MKKQVFLSFLLAATLVATVSCAPKGKKKKKSTTNTSSSDGIDDRIWEAGFKGCIRIAGEGRCTADGIDEVDPASTLNKQLFAVFTNSISGLGIAGSPEEYDMSLEYTYSVENGSGNPEDYFESKIDNDDKTVVFFKNFPALNTALESCPKIRVKATGTIEGHQREKNYTLRLNPYDLSFHEMPLTEIYAPKTKCFDWMTEDFTTQGHETACAGAFGPDVSKYDAWWQNEENKKVHAAIETYGYLTYMSPDKNNGILQCGDQAIQLYQVAEYAGWEPTKAVIMNRPVVVRGELSGGFGNLQISYIREIFPAPSNISVAQPTAPAEFTEAMISNIKWSENPLFNKIVKATSVKFNGNVHQIKNHSAGEATEVLDEITGSALDQVNFSSYRYEFDVLIGSTVLTVQTDYHIVELYPELSSTLKSIVKKSKGDSVKIGGTIRWLNDRSVIGGNDSTTRDQGKWEIVPYLPEHAVAS